MPRQVNGILTRAPFVPRTILMQQHPRQRPAKTFAPMRAAVFGTLHKTLAGATMFSAPRRAWSGSGLRTADKEFHQDALPEAAHFATRRCVGPLVKGMRCLSSAAAWLPPGAVTA